MAHLQRSDAKIHANNNNKTHLENVEKHLSQKWHKTSNDDFLVKPMDYIL